jgi:anti-sigma regulatory factor (Ser/Thr protein kinase)
LQGHVTSVNGLLHTSLGAETQQLIRVREPSDVGEARRRGAAMARAMEFDQTATGKLALGITEAAMNIVKHAGEGEVLIRALQYDSWSALEVMALDRGRGIDDLARSMRDGYSTAGSPGTGLGALQRLSDEFQILSATGRGTAIRFLVGKTGSARQPRAWVSIGAVCVPKPGEATCGDAWALLERDGVHTLLVVDGLGHGSEAATAAHAAVDLAVRHAGDPMPAVLIDALHAGMRATRGAAAACVRLDPQRATGVTCGIGNIGVAVRRADVTRKLVSHNGIVGHRAHKIQEFPFDFSPGALLIAHSDGLDTRWRVEEYPGLESAHPALIAGVLYRDHRRGRDDATIVVVRNTKGSG